MKSVNFEEATNKIAENQPEFKTVHSQFQSSDQSINLCFELDDDEIETIRKEKRIWYKQVIGKESMQPIMLSTNKWEIIEDPINNINDNSAELLQMKKADRGNELKQSNETISRLKRWQAELDAKEVTKATKNIARLGRTARRTGKECAEAIQRF